MYLVYETCRRSKPIYHQTHGVTCSCDQRTQRITCTHDPTQEAQTCTSNMRFDVILRPQVAVVIHEVVIS